MDNLPGKNHITCRVLIHQRAVFKNGTKILENEAKDPLGFLDQIYAFTGMKYPKFYKMDNLSKLGLLASELLLKDTGVSRYDHAEIGVVLSNASASLDTDIKYFRTVQEIPSPSLFVYTLPNIVIGEICIRNRFKGENAFFISPDFDVPFITGYVQNLINNNILQCCICGWLELFEGEYKASIFLVEKASNSPSVPLLFDEVSIAKLYHSENG